VAAERKGTFFDMFDKDLEKIKMVWQKAKKSFLVVASIHQFHRYPVYLKKGVENPSLSLE